MKTPRFLLALSLVAAGACDRCATKAEPDAAPPAPQMTATPFDPVPSPVAAAMALRASDPCKGLELLDEAYVAAEDAGDVRTAAIALHREGDLLHDCDDLPESMVVMDSESKYRRAYSLYLLLGEQRLAGLAANDLGLEFRGSDEDVKWFTEAVRLRRATGSPIELMKSLNNLGGALMLADRSSEAVPVLIDVIKISAEAGEREVERRARTNLGATYLDLVEAADGGDAFIERAREELLKAQQLNLALGKDEDVCHGLMTHQFEACHVLIDPDDGGR